MKKILTALCVLCTGFCIAQDYVIDGIKPQQFFGIIRAGNNVELLFKQKNELRVATLNSELNEINSTALSFNLCDKDALSSSHFNGKAMLLCFDIITYSNIGGQTASHYLQQYHTLDLNNNVLGEITGTVRAAKMAASKIYPAPDGSGFFTIAFDEICKYDNTLNVVWTYKYPKSFTCSKSTGDLADKNIIPYNIDNDGITLLLTKNPKGFSTAETDKQVVSISPSSGQELFNYTIAAGEKKVFYKLSKIKGRYYLNGMVGTYALNSMSPGFTGSYQLVLDEKGHLVSERTNSSSEFGQNAYYCDLLMTDTGSVLILERSNETGFYAHWLDTAFVLKSTVIAKHEKSVEESTNSRSSLFGGSSIQSDYTKTLPLQHGVYEIIYRKRVAGENRNYMTFVASYASAEHLQPSNAVNFNKLVDIQKKGVFVQPLFNWEDKTAIVGYLDEENKKYIVTRVSLAE